CGVSYRKLTNIKGIEELTGAGVYYGASMVEALASQDEDVYMIGGANSAGQAAVHFSKYSKKVTLVVRGDSLAKNMSYYLVNQISRTPNIHILLNSKVVEVDGENRLQSIALFSNSYALCVRLLNTYDSCKKMLTVQITNFIYFPDSFRILILRVGLILLAL